MRPNDSGRGGGFLGQVLLGAVTFSAFLVNRGLDIHLGEQSDARSRDRIAIESVTTIRRDARRAYVACLEARLGLEGTQVAERTAVQTLSADVGEAGCGTGAGPLCDIAEVQDRADLAREVAAWLAEVLADGPRGAETRGKRDHLAEVDRLADAIRSRRSWGAKRSDEQTGKARALQSGVRLAALGFLLSLVASIVLRRSREAARAHLELAEREQREQREVNAVLERCVAERTLELKQANATLSKEMEVRLKMESELRQAHKLESLGRMAAGVAHEINNPMAFVTANLHYLIEQLHPTQAQRRGPS